jgi:pimeloyl-ACP methyl ester carboxylesterase
VVTVQGFEAAEHEVTGAALLGFAVGWAVLAWSSSRWTDQPQRWALAGAAWTGLVGLALVVFSPSVDTMGTLGWIWPPALLVLVVWMALQARRRLRSRVRFWLVYPTLAVMALVAIAGAVGTVLESMAPGGQAAAGQMVDVGGHRLYLHCTGSGSPTVLLSNGLGEHTASWAWISPSVARDTRICAYDRAGQGRSEAAAEPQDGEQVAADLHTMLDRAHITGPYVLAGHSIGGVYNLIFAARYPTQVAGVVLLDSATPHQFTALPNYSSFYSTWSRVSPLLPSLARMGLGRVAFGTNFGGLPSAARDEERAIAATARELTSQRLEFGQLPTTYKQAQGAALNGKPLVVITAGQGQAPGWSAAQDALAGLSTNALHRTVTQATHATLLEDQDLSSQSSRAILQAVQAARSDTPLTP